MVLTFRKYLWQQRKCPQATFPHIGWYGKSICAMVGTWFLIGFGTYYGLSANKFFMLLYIGIPFLWFYMNYCFQKGNIK